MLAETQAYEKGKGFVEKTLTRKKKIRFHLAFPSSLKRIVL